MVRAGTASSIPEPLPGASGEHLGLRRGLRGGGAGRHPQPDLLHTQVQRRKLTRLRHPHGLLQRQGLLHEPGYGASLREGLRGCGLPPRRNTDKPALLVELKWNKSAKGAIEQIKERQYADWVKEYTGDILLVGINYDQEKGHQCVIETFEKE